MRVIGVDLAWAVPEAGRRANETGVVAVEPDGRIVDAGWTVGLDATVAWIERLAQADGTLVFVDAPLVVTNATGQRACEREVGRRYGKWKVSANSTNLGSPRLAGVYLRERLEALGWPYDDGLDGPPQAGQRVTECYPYTTIVGAVELGFDLERPRYKRKPRCLRIAEFRPIRAKACDDLIRRIAGLDTADPPIRLASHPATRALIEESSPTDDRAYKHREDLLDAAICAWTGMLWCRWGLDRCHVLGTAPDVIRPAATIIAPYRNRAGDRHRWVWGHRVCSLQGGAATT